MPILPRLVPLLVLAFAASTSRADAPADTLSVAPGDRIRVFASTLEHPLIGRFEGSDSLSLRLAFDNRPTGAEIVRASILRLEASRGKSNRPLQGALLGWSVGMVSGTLIGFALEEDRDDCSSPDCGVFSRGGGGPLLTGVLGATGGLVLGLLVGSSIRRDRWRPAELPPPVAP